MSVRQLEKQEARTTFRKWEFQDPLGTAPSKLYLPTYYLRTLTLITKDLTKDTKKSNLSSFLLLAPRCQIEPARPVQ